jgi:hypothetical protein
MRIRRKSARTIILALLLIPVVLVVIVGIQVHSIEDFSTHHYLESVEHHFGLPSLPQSTNNNDKDDREPIIKILRQAGYDLDNRALFHEDILASLPKWSEITSFYGQPKIVGLETCQAFQESVAPTDRLLAVAGTFNSGTNFFTDLLKKNCWNPDRMRNSRNISKGVQWQVPWGKHRPEESRGNHRVEGRNGQLNHEHFLPVVTIRDPYTWMQSMCRQNYGAQFDHGKDSCPNIIPYATDIEAHPRYGGMTYIPINVVYGKGVKVKHMSLPHMWNEWYDPYINNVTYPRLMVRLEDLIFHAATVIPQICECFGGEYHDELRHHAEVSNKNHGIDLNGTAGGLMRSVIKYGNITNRRKGYPPNQLQAAKDILDPNTMDLFGYRYEPSSTNN